MDTIKITKKGVAWFNKWHPWVYRDDIAAEKIPSAPAGRIVTLLSESNKFLAKAFYNPRSQIALRIITRKDEEIDRDFWLGRIKQAAGYRKNIVKDTNAYKLIFSESDGLPGLIVDLYADTMVIQITSLGMDLLREEIADILLCLLKPKAVILRNDVPMRKLEGLSEEKAVLYGKNPGLIEVFEGDVKYLADVWDGHKTGAYLDQRENRIFVDDFFAAARIWDKAMDAFCYQGGFSLHLAGKAKEVIAVDSSDSALNAAKKNLELNNIKNVTIVNANVFDKLNEFSKAGEKFDIIVLDPPPFAKSKRELSGARRGYKELNLRAIQCLNEGGYLTTFSCSYNFSEDELMAAVRQAAGDAKKEVRLIAKLIQSKDHPICVTHPESHYLKGFVLRLV